MRAKTYFEASGRISFIERIIFAWGKYIMVLPGKKEDAQGLGFVVFTSILFLPSGYLSSQEGHVTNFDQWTVSKVNYAWVKCVCVCERERETCVISKMVNREWDLHLLFFQCCVEADLCVVVPPVSLILCDPMDCSVSGSSILQISWSLLRVMSIESVMLSNCLILWLPLLSSVFPSIRAFSNELSFCIRWLKY